MATQVFQRVTESNVQQRRCGHCGELGHSVRTCNDPHINNQVTDFYQRIGRNESNESIISWFLENRSDREMRLLCMKTLNVSYHRKFNEREIRYMLRVEIQKIHDNTRKVLINRLCNTVIEMKRNHVSTTLEEFRSFCLAHTHIDSVRSIDMQIHIRNECDKFQEFNEFVGNLQGLAKRPILRQIASSGFTLEILKDIERFYGHVFHPIQQQLDLQEYQRRMREQQHYRNQRQVMLENLREKNKIEWRNLRLDVTKKSSELFDCPICMETIDKEEVARTNCDHVFCKSCIKQVCDAKTRNGHPCPCPICRTQIKMLTTISYDVQEE
jgi:hypothetical protein